MRKIFAVLLALVIIPVMCLQAEELPKEKKDAAVDNLTVGIESQNQGLRTSSANVLSGLIDESYLESSEASEAMIPLLKMLDKGETECERIAAAVALFKLGNSIGIYKLRGFAIFDENEKVSSVCKNLYYSYHKLNGTEYFIDF